MNNEYLKAVSFSLACTSEKGKATIHRKEVNDMADKNKSQEAFNDCCSGSDSKFPQGKSEEMSRMMDKFCGEGSSFDCSTMMEKFRSEDGSRDCGEMMKAMHEMCGSDSDEKKSE
jgi:hypothetical protein